MTCNVFDGTLNPAQLNSLHSSNMLVWINRVTLRSGPVGTEFAHDKGLYESTVYLLHFAHDDTRLGLHVTIVTALSCGVAPYD